MDMCPIIKILALFLTLHLIVIICCSVQSEKARCKVKGDDLATRVQVTCIHNGLFHLTVSAIEYFMVLNNTGYQDVDSCIGNICGNMVT